VITPAAIVSVAAGTALVVLAIAFLLTAWRVISGPTLPDRILGLDMLTGIAIGFIAVVSIKTHFPLYIDIAISLGLVGFLATVAFARFVLSRGPPQDDVPGLEPRPEKPKDKRKPKQSGKTVKAGKEGKAR
jgi:multicomponent Na+:H+ antiporter subunit F